MHFGPPLQCVLIYIVSILVRVYGFETGVDFVVSTLNDVASVIVVVEEVVAADVFF